ncbi:MAG: hypothetical protein HYS21_08210 [Deltaproteobacteria bacterium]|nr:hypothetical protein [Deltaproteobacteria bacterium]
MLIIVIVFLAFLIPSAYIIGKEFLFKKDKKAVPKKKEPFSAAIFVKLVAVLMVISLPIFFLSDFSYSHYRANDAAFKVAFKHTGKRVSDCGESDMMKKEGDRYRKELKEVKRVQMSMQKLADCPRERHPVSVELWVDGKQMLNKSYSPTGLKKDMASYIYDEFMVGPGTHRFQANLYDKGNKAAPDYTLDQVVNIKPKEIKVVRFDDKINKLVVE